MNIQTEHLENHTARLTVEIDVDRLDKAKRAAAKKIAKQVNIPGFRKGKAPYNIIVRNFGEANILQEAVEDLSQDIYRESLEDQAENLQPYGPGAWEDFTLEPSPTFIYTVPLQPTVELNAYRDVKLDYEEQEVDDETVDRAMERVREQEAVVEESDQPVVIGNRVTLDIHSEFADEAPEIEGEASDEADESEEDAETVAEVAVESEVAADVEVEDTADIDDDSEEDVDAESADTADAEEDEPIFAKGDQFIHEHDAQVTLNADDEPILPGFNAALEGAVIDEAREFDLDIPEDSEEYPDIAGRKIHFNVTVKKVEVVTLPELNDDLAARITEEDENGPLSLLELRMRMRDDLQKEMERRAKDEYASSVLDEIVKGATVSYPEMMVEEQVDAMLGDLDQRLRQQGMPLETYIQVTGQSMDEVKAQYREPAIKSLQRSLVLGELSRAEEITVKDSQINGRIDEMLLQFGEQAEGLRSVFDNEQMRENIANDLLTGNVLERLVLIGRGLEIPDEVEEEAAEAEAEAEEPVVEDAEFTEVKAEVDSVEAESTAGASEPEATDEDTEASESAGENEDKVDD